jgi:hypothetical protein
MFKARGVDTPIVDQRLRLTKRDAGGGSADGLRRPIEISEEGPCAYVEPLPQLRGLGHGEHLFSRQRHVVNLRRVLLHCLDEFLVVRFAHRLATIASDLLGWHGTPPGNL